MSRGRETVVSMMDHGQGQGESRRSSTYTMFNDKDVQLQPVAGAGGSNIREKRRSNRERGKKVEISNSPRGEEDDSPVVQVVQSVPSMRLRSEERHSFSSKENVPMTGMHQRSSSSSSANHWRHRADSLGADSAAAESSACESTDNGGGLYGTGGVDEMEAGFSNYFLDVKLNEKGEIA